MGRSFIFASKSKQKDIDLLINWLAGACEQGSAQVTVAATTGSNSCYSQLWEASLSGFQAVWLVQFDCLKQKAANFQGADLPSAMAKKLDSR